MANESLEVLLRGSNRVNNHVDTAIQKTIAFLQNQNDEVLVGILNDLMTAQLELVSLDKGMIETIVPEDKEYLSEANSRIASTKDRQVKLLGQLNPTVASEQIENESSFIK